MLTERRPSRVRRAGEADARLRAAAKDNALTRTARDMQHSAFVWRHGAAVDAFAAGRQEVLASCGELRERTRADGDTVALSRTFSIWLASE